MANSFKNIVITPNIGNTADPKIVFSGGNTTANTTISMFVYPDANGTLSFEGNSGQLFSVTNDLANSIFSVNDISGLPSIDVFANGQINLAPFGGNIGIGTSSPTARLEVSGSINATDFNSTSDIKLKNNINTINNGLEIITTIDPVSFNWKDNGKKSYGVIAQDMEKILPELVSGDDTKHVSYIQLIAFLIASVKELNDKVEELKNKA